jgi:hypothetical protein
VQYFIPRAARLYQGNVQSQRVDHVFGDLSAPQNRDISLDIAAAAAKPRREPELRRHEATEEIESAFVLLNMERRLAPIRRRLEGREQPARYDGERGDAEHQPPLT